MDKNIFNCEFKNKTSSLTCLLQLKPIQAEHFDQTKTNCDQTNFFLKRKKDEKNKWKMPPTYFMVLFNINCTFQIQIFLALSASQQWVTLKTFS